MGSAAGKEVGADFQAAVARLEFVPLIAVLFVVFDVETIFLFPWAVMFHRLGLFGLVEMLVFLVILVVGYFYCWKRKALDWA